jgi:hypothetical protein
LLIQTIDTFKTKKYITCCTSTRNILLLILHRS